MPFFTEFTATYLGPLAVVIVAVLGGLYFVSSSGKSCMSNASSRTITDHHLDSPKSRPQPPAPEKAQQESRGPKTAIDPKTFTEFPISEKTQTSHNTAIYRFKLPTEDSILGLPIGQHISLAANLDVKDPKTGEVTNKEVVRSYTPISSDVNPGYFDLLIKSYPTGNISRHLATLNVGDKMKVRGPKGAMVYTPNMVRRFGMIAGGTGITPMLQICEAIRRGRKEGDKTEVDLIFANVNEEDILLREDLDKLAKEDGFNVYYVLNNPPSGWTGGVGFVTVDMIKVSLNAVESEGVLKLLTKFRNVSRHQQRTSRSSSVALHPWFPPSRRPPNHWALRRLVQSASSRIRSLRSRRIDGMMNKA
jgi:cytochrome-b5 reductase